MKKLTLTINYEVGDTVFVKTDIDQQQRIVTGISIRNNDILYQVSCGIEISEHYDFELSSNINVLSNN